MKHAQRKGELAVLLKGVSSFMEVRREDLYIRSLELTGKSDASPSQGHQGWRL